MRTLTAQQNAILSAPNYATHARLMIEDQAGDLIDRSSFFEAVTWSQSIDEPLLRLDANLGLYRDHRDTGPQSMSPLWPTNAIDVGRTVELWVACTPVRSQPVASHWALVFNGVIQRTNFAQDPMSISAVGPYPSVTTRWVEEEGVSYDDMDMLPMMQAIIADWAPDVVLTAPNGAPGFHVTHYGPNQQSVLDALQRLADAVGWVLLGNYDDGEGRFVIQFLDPLRDTDVPLWTFGPDDYDDVTRLDLDLHTIRNAITIGYLDADGALHRVNGTVQDSIDRYGRLWMEIIEGTGSPIDTQIEAEDMLTYALQDLALPKAEQEIATKFFWPVEVNDFYRFLPNGVHYEDEQDWAVVAFSHAIGPQEDETRILVRGQPSGSYRSWRGRQFAQDVAVQIEPWGNVNAAVHAAGTLITFYRITANGNERAQSWGYAQGGVAPPTAPNTFGNGRFFDQLTVAVSEATQVTYVSWWWYDQPNQGGIRSQRIVIEMPFVDISTET